MIRSFRSKETALIFIRKRSMKLPQDIQQVALRRLRMIDAASTLQDLAIPPGNRLEALKGERKEGWSIRINDQWRICFVWRDEDAYEVEIIDYH
jgi:toxin HigB-1